MRFDVLNLILGWTLVALTVPLLLCVVATGYLDNWELAFRAFSIPAGLSLLIGSMMLRFGTKRNTHMRLRDREAFAAVALVWPFCNGKKKGRVIMMISMSSICPKKQ